MKKVDIKDPHRKKHFEMFANMNHPHFSITARIEISSFLTHIKQSAIPFTPAIVYLISRTANEIPQFRQRIRDNSIIEHDSVHPSFAVSTEVSDVFSFCYVDYHPSAAIFIEAAKERMEIMKSEPSLEDEDARDDYLFLSVIPWIHFTSTQHAMSYHPHDSVPRITWGKYMKEGDKIWMPLSVQAHHAVVDGRHVGQFYEQIQLYMDSGGWMSHGSAGSP